MRNGRPKKVGVRAAASANGTAPDSAIARRRREQIVRAATEIIASEGLHRLSLARIEKRTGMTRGQLTYYFPAKEAILLAVFDRMLARMIEEAIADAERKRLPQPGSGRMWECLRHGFARALAPEHTARGDQLRALIHTFMAQIPYRGDYQRKLAAANAGWREFLAGDVASSVAEPRPVAPPVLASILMALFQGLSGQLAVDPEAFDRREMAGACLRLLAPLFGVTDE